MHTLSTFHHYIQRARNASLSTPGRAQAVLQEHRAILQAIMDRDPERAERLTIEHIRNAVAICCQQIAEGGAEND